MTKKMNSQTPSYHQTAEQVLANMQSQANGLDRAEAQARLQQHGPNALPEKKANRPGYVSSPILTMC